MRELLVVVAVCYKVHRPNSIGRRVGRCRSYWCESCCSRDGYEVIHRSDCVVIDADLEGVVGVV